MSDSPSTGVAASAKRPLEDESTPAGPTDQPEAKRPALDKNVHQEALTSDSENKSEDTPEAKTENGTSATNGHMETDAKSEEVAPAPVTSAIPSIQDTQPIQSTAEHHDRSARSQSVQHHPQQDETGWIHVRAVISSAEAATVIGKSGENVSQIRRLSGSKCTVSDYSRGAVERVLTVSGLVDAVAKARKVPPFHVMRLLTRERLLDLSFAHSTMNLLKRHQLLSRKHILSACAFLIF